MRSSGSRSSTTALPCGREPLPPRRATVSPAPARKLWKQKGTGRARVGSIRTPLWRGGGTVHGPQPRCYEYAFPQKKLMGALRSAIAAKIADGKFTIVDSFEVAEAEDQALPHRSRQARGRQDHFIGRVQPQTRREALSRLAQPRRCRACAQLRGSPLRSAPLRARGLLEGCDRGSAGNPQEVRIEAQQGCQKEVA